MLPQIKIIIYDWRPIVARGLLSIIKEEFPRIHIEAVTNEVDFLQRFKTINPQIVFLNEKKFNILQKKIPDSTYIIIIGQRKISTSNKNIAFILPTSASVDYIILNLKKILGKLDPDLLDENSDSELTSREREIVRLIALGYTNQQIAEKLFISPHTVVTHRKNITKKLGIKTISGLTIYAILNGIITLEELEQNKINR